MEIDILKKICQRQRDRIQGSAYNAPDAVFRDFGADLLDYANLIGDPNMLRLALSAAVTHGTLNGAVERQLTEQFLDAAHAQGRATEAQDVPSLGGLVLADLRDLFTPRSGQIRVTEATKEFTKYIGDDPRAISVATSILEQVAERLFAQCRQEINSFFETCIQHCSGDDVTVAIARLETELFKKAAAWHSTASEYRFGDA